MKELKLTGKTGTSTIMPGSSLKQLREFCDPGKTVVITDSNVSRLYGESFSQYRSVVIEPGESRKTLDTVVNVYDSLLRMEVDRSSLLLGIGGGLVCDVTGFVASTYLRGLVFGFAPTTLLAQVDASVGGKNGVNFKRYKNLIGTFNQPKFVLYDFEVLRTLPRAELKNGFAEAIKQALIANRALFGRIERSLEAVLALDTGAIERMVFDCLKVKIGIVSQDEKETGERRKLNFGHTFGHALEKTAGLSHGEAVGVGMLMESRLSETKGLLQKAEVDRIRRVLEKAGLPVKIKGDRAAIMDAIRKDKKREGGFIYSILLDGIGRAVVEKIKINDIEAIVNDMC